MSEELNQEAGEKPEQKEGGEQKEFTAIEQEALAQGWVPKEEFEGEEGKWVDAGEFVRRGELFKKIDHQGREVKELRKALQAFQQHYTKVNEAAYERALSDLKKEFKQANREGDFEKADKLEAEIESVEKEAKTVIEQSKTVVQEAQTIHPEFAAWVSKNDWYATQPHMKTFADYKGLEFSKLGLTPSEVLAKVEVEVRKEFPNKFKNPNQSRPAAVEGANNRGATRASKGDDYQLTEQERRVMESLTSQRGKDGKPFITKEQYIKDLKSIKKEQ